MERLKHGSPEELLRDLREAVRGFLEAQDGSEEDLRISLIDLRKATERADRYLNFVPLDL